MPDLAYDSTMYHPIDSVAARAAGYTAGIGYVSLDANKDLTKAMAKSMLAAGLGVGLIWETTADRALSGAPGGKVDGPLAKMKAANLGYPITAPIWCNIGDFEANASQLDTIEAYYRAFQIEVNITGGYGTRFIIDNLVERGCTGYWWENAMDDGGLLGDFVSPNAYLYQRVTPTLTIPDQAGDYDEDVILKSIPWWKATGGNVDVPKQTVTLPRPLDPNGNGFYSAAEVGVTDVNNISGITWIVRPPATVGGYDLIPRWGIDANQDFVVEGGIPGGQYGMIVRTDA